MSKYGQYCPVAQALEIVGDRWTLLIIRDMLTGTQHFNDLARGLPGISRGLLADRLRMLERTGLVEKHSTGSGRQTTAYHLTQAGQELYGVIDALMNWGAAWAFNDPTPEQLDPLLLLWWMHNRVKQDELPEERIVIEFHFYGAQTVIYWLILARSDVTICETDPGYEVNVLVSADVAAFFKLWLGWRDYDEVLDEGTVCVEGLPRYVRAFPSWFAWSPAHAAVRAARFARPNPR